MVAELLFMYIQEHPTTVSSVKTHFMHILLQICSVILGELESFWNYEGFSPPNNLEAT